MAVFTGNFHSDILGYDTQVHVLLPEGKRSEPLKILYLLHGRGDDHSCWTRFTSLERYVKELPLAVVMPTGEEGFYTDSVGGKRFFTYITEELPEKIGQWFSISKKPEDTFIAGQSMGGYGAMKAGFTYPQKYGMICAISPVTDINRMLLDVPDNLKEGFCKNVDRVFGCSRPIPESMGLLHLAKKAKEEGKSLPKVELYVGTEDFFYESIQTFYEKLRNVFTEINYKDWNGGHEWEFWDTAIRKLIGKLPLERERKRSD